MFAMRFSAILITTAVARSADFRCGDSNVSCPATSYGCINQSLGLKWACNVSSGRPGHPSTTCYTGARDLPSADKKNVLLIGDSVSNGYFFEGTAGHNVPDLVGDIAKVQHAPWSPGSGGAGDTQHGLDCLDIYLKPADGRPVNWDLVTFNFGLHNLDNSSGAVASYATQLQTITERLLQTGAKIQYHLTTPMMPTCCRGSPLKPAGEGSPRPNCGPTDVENHYPCEDVVVQLNNHAKQIMEKFTIPVVDLHTTVTDFCGNRYTNCSICRKEPCSFHYNQQGYDMISKLIADAIRASLSRKRDERERYIV